MPEVSATYAARNFADLLDAVEHRGTDYLIVRRGKVVAHLEPVSSGRGADVKAALLRHRGDRAWTEDLDGLRDLLVVEERR
ncbi:MAG: type II toxin-antitoxin system Phd/YefM family antitoxin [Acidimicrobiia bacterium]|nr:type II toxin-antitoxin system Phd/YefM family antitoxin [Acidimicrobiia bacterium]